MNAWSGPARGRQSARRHSGDADPPGLVSPRTVRSASETGEDDAADTQTRRAQRREERRRAILETAGQHFLAQGFSESSMSAIAAECGGSKSTLWNHFSSKTALFEAYLDTRVDTFGHDLDDALLARGTVAEILELFGRVFLHRVLSPDARALRQLLTAEEKRFPELAEAFYKRGPARIIARLSDFLTREMTADRLRIGDPETAARQFLGLCQSGGYADMEWHRPISDPFMLDSARDARTAVDTFMRAWGPDQKP